MDAKAVGVLLLVGAAVMALVGVGLMTGLLGWFGRLPGDIRHEGDNVRIYAPITSMLLLSVVLSLVFFLVSRLR